MKKILILSILFLSSCEDSGTLYYTDAVVKEIVTEQGSFNCTVRIRSRHVYASNTKYRKYYYSSMYNCPCNKWKIGDTIKFN